MKFVSIVSGAAVRSAPSFATRASTLIIKRFITRLVATAAVLCVSFAGNVWAASKTYVSNFAVAGNPAVNPVDAGDCASSAPCRTFSYAYSETDVGGEIICMSSGSFGSVTIYKSITISCLGTSASAGYIDIYTSASDRVVLRGVDVQGLGDNAMTFNTAGTLILDQVKVSGGASTASALYFRPTAAGKLIVTDSLLNTRGSTSSGAAIRIMPSSGGTAQAILSRVSVAGSAFGVAVDGSSSSGGINVTINDSDMAGSAQDGLVATTSASGAPIGVTVINSRSTNNGYGIRSIGSNVTVRVKDSNIIGNGTGLSGGGALISGGGNTIQANATNGSFTGSYAQQ